MKQKRQIIFIHGGNPFANKKDFYGHLKVRDINTFSMIKGWAYRLPEKLGKNYQMIFPKMPAQENADYVAWKIWFERHLEFIKDKSPILIGHSLGGTFLIKYLSENKFSKKISQIHLVAPCVIDTPITKKLKGKLLTRLSSFKVDLKKINKISKICKEIYLWHSRDDNVVPFTNAEIIKKKIPLTELHIFKNRGHFRQKSFPEIIKIIKKLPTSPKMSQGGK